MSSTNHANMQKAIDLLDEYREVEQKCGSYLYNNKAQEARKNLLVYLSSVILFQKEENGKTL